MYTRTQAAVLADRAVGSDPEPHCGTAAYPVAHVPECTVPGLNGHNGMARVCVCIRVCLCVRASVCLCVCVCIVCAYACFMHRNP